MPLTANLGGEGGPPSRDGGGLLGVSPMDEKGTAGHVACPFDSRESLFPRYIG